MSKGKGWFLESRRHKLASLGIKTGRKMLPKKPISLLVGDQKMFYPKQKEVSFIYEAPVEQIRKGFNKVYGRYPTDTELNDMLLEGSEAWKPFVMNYPKKNDRTKKIITGAVIGATVGALTYKGKRQRMSKQAYQLLKSVKVDTELKSAEKKVLVDLISANQLKTSKQLIKAKTDLLTLRKSNSLSKGILTYHPEIKGQQLRIRITSPKKYSKFRTQDVGRKGFLQRVVGYSKKTGWVTQSLRLNLKDFKTYGKASKSIRSLRIPKYQKELALKQAKRFYKMKGKKLSYNDDVTYEQPIVSGMEIPEKVGFLKKVGRGAVAIGRGAKATFEKGQEISAKLRAIQEEREVRAIAKTQRELLKAQSQLQVVRQKKTLEATKKQLESERESIFPKIF